MVPNDDVIAQETNRLAEFLAATDYKDIPAPAIHRAKLITADTIGVALRGSLEPEMQNLYGRLPKDESAVVFKGGFPKTGPVNAAMVNATAACFLELDEGSRPTGHPAIHILPPALALTQASGKSGQEYLTALILGYEVQFRLQKAAKLRWPVHPHGNFGHVGAITALGKLSGWNAEQFRQGLNCAAGLVMATSWKPCTTGSTVRNAYPGLSAQTAFTVKDLVESGFTGYQAALGETFGEILGESFDHYALTRELGGQFGIINNYFKFHASCGLTHPVLDAAADALNCKLVHGEYPPMQTKVLPDPNRIRSIKVKVAQHALRLNVTAEANQLSAKFSIPYAVAAFVVAGNSHMDNFREGFLTDPRVRALEKLVEMEVEPSFTERWPQEGAAEVSIVLDDGQVLTGRCSNAYGTADKPPQTDDLYAKFCSLTDGTLTDVKKDALWTALLHLETNRDMGNLF